MKLRKKTLIWAGIAAVLVLSVAATLFFRAFQKVSPETILKIMPERVDLDVRHVLYREVGDDNTKWEIRAEKASYIRKENQAFFDKVEIKLYLPDGRTFLMTGDKGQLNTATKDMEISGNVGIVAEGGERFETDSLQYSFAEKRMHTGAAVIMQTPRMQIGGVGMSLSLEHKSFTLLSKVRARIKRGSGG
jgi:LPS export ABC transporter protein LptC